MAWKEMTVEEMAKSMGVDVNEVREKHRLIELIKKARKEKKMSQVQLAKKMGVTQGRIAQIESRVGTAQVNLEVLLAILRELGYVYKIVAKKMGPDGAAA
jgi:transcriptional regulator with XRE-family HTH domain